jgi:hypothetical protein
MQSVCPITDKRINERVARLNAFFTVVFVAAFLVFDAWYAIAFLAYDFAMRGFIDSRFSPMCYVSKWIATHIKLSEKYINAGPKVFAAQVGMFLSAVALIFFLAGGTTVSLILGGMLAIFSFLEGAFGFCVACKLYPLIRSIK